MYREIYKNFMEDLRWLFLDILFDCDGWKLVKLIKQLLFPYISVDRLFNYMGKFLDMS